MEKKIELYSALELTAYYMLLLESVLSWFKVMDDLNVQVT